MQSQRTATGCPGKVPLDKDRRRYCLLGTDSNPVRLVNPRVTERRGGESPAGVKVNTPAQLRPVGAQTPRCGSSEASGLLKSSPSPIVRQGGTLQSPTLLPLD